MTPESPEQDCVTAQTGWRTGGVGALPLSLPQDHGSPRGGGGLGGGAGIRVFPWKLWRESDTLTVSVEGAGRGG